jgi:hypothetical protein
LRLSNLSHNLFLERTRQEMSRAERYCLYLSIVVVDVSDFARAFQGRAEGRREVLGTICGQLAERLGHVVRTSDVVSGFEKNRVALLLMEASGPGLEKVVNRVQAFVSDFLQGQVDVAFRPLVRVYAASFPEEVTAFSHLVSRISGNSELVH